MLGRDAHARTSRAHERKPTPPLLSSPTNQRSLGGGWFCTGPPCPASHNNSESAGGPYPADGALLFDLEADPTETTDLSRANPDVVARLAARIAELNATAVPSAGVCAPPDPRRIVNGSCTPWL